MPTKPKTPLKNPQTAKATPKKSKTLKNIPIPKLRHSAKPWSISQPSGNDGEAEVIVDAKGRIIAWTANSYNEKTKEEYISPQNKANGVLIANAPMLLGALEKIVSMGESKHTAELAGAIARETLAKLQP
jgi:hypothetical protein